MRQATKKSLGSVNLSSTRAIHHIAPFSKIASVAPLLSGLTSSSHSQRFSLNNQLAHTSSSVRSFFSLPSFPPSLNVSKDIHGYEDLNVRDRYSQRGDVLTYKETKRLPFSKHQLYYIAADIESYSSFLPYCAQSNLRSVRALDRTSDDSLESNLITNDERRQWLRGGKVGETFLIELEQVNGFKGLDELNRTSVECRKFDLVKLTMCDSKLFKSLSITWKFKSPREIFNIDSILNNQNGFTSQSSSLREEDNEGTGDAFVSIETANDLSGELYWKAMSEKVLASYESRLNQVYLNNRQN
ncbi:hypothetical protein BY996DRAFT_4576087 [Phakopsora pachyrhizi]|nr:hypothetical protein BY996DRAFT_4576087 [Phakopsora pachyrhizi]